MVQTPLDLADKPRQFLEMVQASTPGTEWRFRELHDVTGWAKSTFSHALKTLTEQGSLAKTRSEGHDVYVVTEKAASVKV